MSFPVIREKKTSACGCKRTGRRRTPSKSEALNMQRVDNVSCTANSQTWFASSHTYFLSHSSGLFVKVMH